MKKLRKILRVSQTTKKTNEWDLNKDGVKKELLDTVKARKLAYYGHTMRKQDKTTHGEDGQHQYVDRTPRGRVNQNDKRTTEDRDNLRKYVHCVANSQIKDS